MVGAGSTGGQHIGRRRHHQGDIAMNDDSLARYVDVDIEGLRFRPERTRTSAVLAVALLTAGRKDASPPPHSRGWWRQSDQPDSWSASVGRICANNRRAASR
jgi:hypothetical protein